MVAAENTINAAKATETEGIGFTEVMSGYIYIGDDIEDFNIAANQAKASCQDARFFLSVRAWNSEIRKWLLLEQQGMWYIY